MTDEAPTLVVFGAAGQLGRALIAAGPPPAWRLAAFSRQDASVTDPAAVTAALAGIRRGLVVNAAAYTAVDRAETEPEAAFAVNRDGARIVAAAAVARGLALVQVSTDYVFAGDKPGAYAVDDATGPLSVYGASKLAGELAVREAAPRHVILRTAWLFGRSGRNFARTILKLARERDHLGVVADQAGCPTPAEGLAEAILALAPRLLDEPANSPAFGTFHLCGDEPTTWHGFAVALLEAAAKSGIQVARLRPITTADYPTPARRPANSVLDCRRIAAVHGIRPPSWRSAVTEGLSRLLEDA